MEFWHVMDAIASCVLAAVLGFVIVAGICEWAFTKRWERKAAKRRAEFWARLGTDEATVQLKKTESKEATGI